jgi:hypothetical protein
MLKFNRVKKNTEELVVEAIDKQKYNKLMKMSKKDESTAGIIVGALLAKIVNHINITDNHRGA